MSKGFLALLVVVVVVEVIDVVVVFIDPRNIPLKFGQNCDLSVWSKLGPLMFG